MGIISNSCLSYAETTLSVLPALPARYVIFPETLDAIFPESQFNCRLCPYFNLIQIYFFKMQAVMESSTQLPSMSTSTAKNFEYKYEY